MKKFLFNEEKYAYPPILNKVPNVQGIANRVRFPVITENSMPKERRLIINPTE